MAKPIPMDLFGTPQDFTPGGPDTLPCFWYTAATNPYVANTLSTFGKAANCSTSVPKACVTAAQQVLTSPTTGQTGLRALGTYGCYMQGNSVIVPPTQGTYGTMTRDELRGKGFHSFDISLSKNWKFRERVTMQFRAEFFNILNSTDYIPAGASTGTLSAPAAFGMAPGTPDSVNPVIGTGSPREIQFGLKFIFQRDNKVAL